MLEMKLTTIGWNELADGLLPLSSRDLCGIDLSDRLLQKTSLNLICFANANFRGCLCFESDFSYSNLANCDLSYGNFEGCNFCGASLIFAKVEGTRFVGAQFDDETILPFSFDRAMELGMVFVGKQFRQVS